GQADLLMRALAGNRVRARSRLPSQSPASSPSIGRLLGSTLLLSLAACASSKHKPDLRPLDVEHGESGYAIRAAKVLTCDDQDHIYTPGLILVRDSKIAYVGPERAIPSGYPLADLGSGWAVPGMIELHSH